MPRWLVGAAGLVFVGWLGTEMYFNVQIMAANKERAAAEASQAVNEAKSKQQRTDVTTSRAVGDQIYNSLNKYDSERLKSKDELARRMRELRNPENQEAKP